MKKILLLFMAVLTLSVTARAADGDKFTVDNLKYSVLSEADHKVTITGCVVMPEGDLVIPSYVSRGSTRYFVTLIGIGAFRGCSSMTSVSIPNSVTSIGSAAFKDCSSMTSVSIPNSVTLIGSAAFSSCSSMTSVSIPNSVTLIGNSAFLNCSSLTSVSIPNSVTSIGSYTFSSCSSLTSVSIPNSVTSIDNYAFYGCSSMTSVSIPNSVTSIGSGAFKDCSSMTSVSIPNSVTSIGSYAFSSCSSLKIIFALSSTPPICYGDVMFKDVLFENVPTDAVVYIPKGTLKAYVVADGWSYFTDFREMGALDIAISETELKLNQGETVTITATISKDDDMTIESETWATSNPDIATVEDGVVTAVAAGTATISFTAVDGFGISHTETCEVTVSDTTGIEGINADSSNAPAEYFNINGVRVNGDNLTPGLYIKRQGNKAEKVLVK